jgi:hypothetical protein
VVAHNLDVRLFLVFCAFFIPGLVAVVIGVLCLTRTLGFGVALGAAFIIGGVILSSSFLIEVRATRRLRQRTNR